jgi:ubiquinone/menaquinone biosynthesis C-methylase UbiE/intracellular sulfur oxidation DsrE/DsrF family protein
MLSQIRKIADFSLVFRLTLSLPLCLALCPPQTAWPQEKSVRPGINDSFRNPNVQEFVGRFEGESREVFVRRHDIVAACRITPGQTVADIGAGTGLFTRLFAEAVGKEGRVIAVDISAKFLTHIAQTCREAGYQQVETLLAKDDSTELPAASVDVAFICDTYHHFEYPLKTMATVQQALKPGGRVIVIDFHRIPGQSSEWALNHVRAGQEVFESEIVQAGFLKTREVRDLLKENYFVEFTKSSAPGLKPRSFPIVERFGGVAPVPQAVERPRAGARVVLDITTPAAPDAVNKGLDRAARLINLYGAAGLKAADVRVVVVLHGEATKSVLRDDFYQPRYGVDGNPNRPLIEALRQAGVEVFVCGQALNNHGFPETAVAADVSIADAALSVVINRQLDGYAYVPIP